MCLAVPGKIVSAHGAGLSRQGRVSFGGAIKDISLAYVPEAEVGAYVIVHAGFAISVLDEEEALETLDWFRQIEDLSEPREPGP